jgi:hypothetical protein
MISRGIEEMQAVLIALTIMFIFVIGDVTNQIEKKRNDREMRQDSIAQITDTLTYKIK